MPIAIQNLLTLALFVMTTGIAVLCVYALRRHRVPGAAPFAALCAATAFYTAGYAMEIQQGTIAGIDIWSRFEYLGLPFIPTCWLLIAVFRAKTGWFARQRTRRILAACLCGFSGVTTIFRHLSGWVPIHYGAMRVVDNGYFPVLQFDKGPWYFVYQGFYVVCGLLAIAIHLSNARTGSRGYRVNSRFFGWISLLPLCVAPVNLFGWFPLGLDSGPFFALFTYLIIAYALFRHNALNLIPLARDRVFDWIGDGVVVLGANLELLDFNRAAKGMFPGLRKSERVEGARETFISDFAAVPAFVGAFLSWFEQSRDTAGPDGMADMSSFPCELAGTDAEGPSHRRHLQIRVTELGGRGEMQGILLMISDITEQADAMRSLEHMARTDSLTGLENRGSFLEGMAAVCAGSRGVVPSGAILLLDLDHFKKINDRYGHLAGDAVLRRMADILRANLRAQDLVGRYGGEEFIAFLPGASDEAALQAAERIRTSVEADRLEWDAHLIAYRTSIGIAAVDAASLQGVHACDTLIGHADEALYQAKRAGRNRSVRWVADYATGSSDSSSSAR